MRDDLRDGAVAVAVAEMSKRVCAKSDVRENIKKKDARKRALAKIKSVMRMVGDQWTEDDDAASKGTDVSCRQLRPTLC